MLFLKHLFTSLLPYFLTVCVHAWIMYRCQGTTHQSWFTPSFRLGGKCLYTLDHLSSPKLLLLILFFLFLWNRVMLSSSGWPPVPHLPASGSWALRLQLWATTSHLIILSNEFQGGKFLRNSVPSNWTYSYPGTALIYTKHGSQQPHVAPEHVNVTSRVEKLSWLRGVN